MGIRLKDDATAQEVFDAVVSHLRKQKKKALGANGRCFYRAPDGKECAAGCILPDDVYVPSMENSSVKGLVVKYLKELPRYFSEHQPLLQKLQETHDNNAVNMWEYCFSRIASKEKLKYTEPTPL